MPTTDAIHLGSTVLPNIGPVTVAVTDQGVCGVALPRWNDHDLRLSVWEAAGFQAKRARHPLLTQALDELAAFAEGRSLNFVVPVDLRHHATFTVRVLRTLMKIPPGQVTTYGKLAAKAGSPGAARAVGGAVGRNPIPIIIPCHRVVASTGIGGFGLGLECKRTLLAIEGVEM